MWRLKKGVHMDQQGKSDIGNAQTENRYIWRDKRGIDIPSQGIGETVYQEL